MATTMNTNRCLIQAVRIVMPRAPWRQKSTAAERMSDTCNKKLGQIRTAGLYRNEFSIDHCYESYIRYADTPERIIVNFASNDYLGLDRNPEMMKAQQKGINYWGLKGSYRQLDGTYEIHKKLENAIAELHGKEDSLVFVSCAASNWGLFNSLLDEKDAVFSDQLNHASIVDGVRQCKSQKLTYKHRDTADLERLLQTCKARNKLIVTDGVFSMDATYAPLKDILDLADIYDAIVMVDDCHGTGVLGDNLRGTDEAFGVHGKPYLITSTLSKALGCSMGGYTAGPKEVVEVLRQMARSYVFSISLPPSMAETAYQTVKSIPDYKPRRDRALRNSLRLRQRVVQAGYPDWGDIHPVFPCIVGEIDECKAVGDAIYELGYHAVALGYPVVPRGLARLRITCTASHTDESVDGLGDALIEAGKRFGVLEPDHRMQVRSRLGIA